MNAISNACEHGSSSLTYPTPNSLILVSGKIKILELQASEATINDWMKLSDIALDMQMSIKTLYYLNKQGLGPRAYKFGRQYLVKRTDYESWIRASECRD